jgi:hypothetical protein
MDRIVDIATDGLHLAADFTKLGQRFHKVADKRFAKSWTTDAIEFRLPCCCYG